ncbi:2-aminoethylphosphonate aminotransferase [Clostridium beijerinckii]|uniref:2-aminoethylphosphonate--pyruvate transaminase n=1 Tax=Clostridium beijerinckii TaxID=1520 RepID=A0AAW3WAW3_CLOBE|nr:2-aminoethylphosphonate--pyruvate transaminase [Clostridium beijerinckii]ALB44483.1 2-aminoethylphosphonate--pyruvate transaminase [Clostridium beijerinckii NRRL B-598]MBC2455953.1 2-aminoethylphosphonate--pyruvate transaminase [Clostridium beijerinckii]MBC2476007.1 2-aminoethylphosphonate--pyruvate transaminase [Clostridium beijerinckii]MCI1477780.1 2-aminoethylphosphonate--pyruvate transaminase [Clostridium beijerinckii]MCI1577904.1 2-aminoethylphosphonate--pyruvate transaminase [Clostrid
MEIRRNILLNPGPATTSDTVKFAQIVPDICPREKEFGSIMEFISRELTEFVGSNEKYTTILFGGSGTAAVEAILSSVVDNKTILIINNGAYGKRMCEIAEIYNLNYIEFKSSPIETINLKELEEVIKKNNEESKINNCGAISHLAVVHHETTTGILNDIELLGEICKKYSIEMIVDAMSSFAGIPIDMDKMNIKYLASSSNKCIQGMAGISFVVADKKALNKTQNIKPRNLYLNIYKQYSYFKDNCQMRFTPPVQTLYALKQAIIEAKGETIEKRYKRYKECCEILWDGLDKLNLNRLIDKNISSMLLTSVIEPKIKNYKFDRLHDYLYSRGFTIYPGKISSENTFRIANIGDIYQDDMRRFVKILEEYFTGII